MLPKTVSFFCIFVISTSTFALENTTPTKQYTSEFGGIISAGSGLPAAFQAYTGIIYKYNIPISDIYTLYLSLSGSHTFTGRTSSGFLYRSFSSLSVYTGGDITCNTGLDFPVNLFLGCGLSYANYTGTYQYFVYPSIEIGGKLQLVSFKHGGTLGLSLPIRVHFRQPLYPSLAASVALDFSVNW